MSETTTCGINGCGADAKPLICRGHFARLPDDLKERMRWAIREGDEMDRVAAVHAAEEELS